MKLRPHQQKAFNAIMAFVKDNKDPCVAECITAWGKSFLVAALAEKIHDLSGKKVLCIQPTKELVQQNFDKFKLTGKPASIYCASIGKSLRHDVIFCSPLSIKPIISRLHCAAVILDECHMVTPTVKNIIEELKATNPNLRVIGMTSTPYRLGTGYIYRYDEQREMEHAKDPYFLKKVYTSDPQELLEMGYLCPIVVGSINSTGYDISNLEIKGGRYTSDSVDRAFLGHGRKTSAIIADVVEQSKDSKCTLIFASTVQHAEECLASLPHGSAIVTGATPRIEREGIIQGMANYRIRYVVNVATLTTGLDVPHIGCIAILRATESSALLSQILGRGMRPHPEKTECVILDYAENIERHFPDGDIFSPEIKANVYDKKAAPYEISCPLCHVQNVFTLRQNEEGFSIDRVGYFTDLDGVRVLNDSGIEIPAHYGRRCFGVDSQMIRCEYRWSSKECPHCEYDNDIAARHCQKCKGELIDPNEKLILDYVAMKKNPREVQCDEVLNVEINETLTRKGDRMHTIDFTLENRTVKLYLPDLPYPSAQKKRKLFKEAFLAGIKTITYIKEKDFWNVIKYNDAADAPPELAI